MFYVPDFLHIVKDWLSRYWKVKYSFYTTVPRLSRALAVSARGRRIEELTTPWISKTAKSLDGYRRVCRLCMDLSPAPLRLAAESLFKLK